jgi:NAD dependent epimerase/dehydratase family enzyme
MSWISLPDLTGAILHLISTETLAGPVNVSAPEPVSNREFTGTLSRVLRRPAVLPVPAIGLRAVFGEMAERTLLSSARVVPARLIQSGYRFDHPQIEIALRAMLVRPRSSSFRV